MRTIALALLLVSLVTVLAQPASAQEPHHYVCYGAAGPITIDGKLDEPSWQRAPKTNPFVDIVGDVNPKPRFETRAMMLWDDTYFYVAADMEEPDVWGTLTERDAIIYLDSDFEVFIDPNGDTFEYYELEINALNTVMDLFMDKPYSEGGDYDLAWDIEGLKHAVHINGTLNHPGDVDQGWSVEIAFPWEVLAEYAHKPAPPNDGDWWRVNFSRVEYPFALVDGEYQSAGVPDNWVWSPQGRVAMHIPEMWGFVDFSTEHPTAVEEATQTLPLPLRFALSQNLPNPFNARTVIGYEVPETGAARLCVYDVAGQRVRTLVDAQRSAGTHSVAWDGRDAAGREAASGVYLYRLEVEGQRVQTRRMVLLR